MTGLIEIPPKWGDFLVNIFKAFTSTMWQLYSWLSLFWGFWLGIFIVWVLVRTIKWALARGGEGIEDEKVSYYQNLTSQLESKDEVPDEKCEMERKT